MAGDDHQYEELSEADCLDLLKAQAVGRIAVIVDGGPVVFPVNYAVDGDAVVFRTDPGTKLAAAAMGKVAFEIDGIDESAESGWSVVVQGVGYEITTAMDLRSEQLRKLSLQPWVPGARAHWVRIVPSSVTGRRVRRSD